MYKAVPFSKAELDELVGNSVKRHGVSNILDADSDCGLDSGWIVPDGRYVLMSYEWDGYHYNALLCLKDRAARISREFGTVELDDVGGGYESALTYDAVTNGLVRFCLNGDSQYIETGRVLTQAQLDALYDLEEFVLKSEGVAEADADGDFDLHVDMGAYVDADKKYHRPSASLAYRSVDEFRRRFINDVRRNVKIAETAVSESGNGGLPITDLGRVRRLDSCRKQKDMCWGYDGFVLAHKDVNPDFDEEKPFVVVMDQDGVRQMHFENFGKFPKDEKVLDDMYKALAASCEKGTELQCVGGATPGGISGISKLRDYGFKKVPMPDGANVYWGGEMDWGKLEKWLNSGRHDDDFLVVDGGKFTRPDEYEGEITPDNTKPRPFKMVREALAFNRTDEPDEQVLYWAHMLDGAFGG